MSDLPRSCVVCGAPAVIRRGGLGEGHDRVRDLCEDCADEDWSGWGAGGQRPGRLPQRTEAGVIIAAVGAFMVFISLFADWLEFGRSPGLGWKQVIGIGLAACVAMLGAMFRALFLVILGLILGGLSVLADWVGFGSQPGFGYQQAAGVILGLAAVAAGVRLARARASTASRRQPAP